MSFTFDDKVTIEDWNCNTNHIMNGHSVPADPPKATYAAEVVEL